MTIQEYVKQYVKGPALRLGADEAAAQVAAGPVVPNDAKLYFPDVEGIATDLFYILSNEPVGATDSVWLNFTDSRIEEVSVLSGGTITASDVYTEGFYASSDSDKNIAFVGIVNLGVFDGGVEYSPANIKYQDESAGDLDTYAISIVTDIQFNYLWEHDTDTDVYYIDLTVAGGPGNIITATIEVDGATNAGTYSIAVLGSSN